MANRPMNKMMYLLLIFVIVSFLNALSMDNFFEEKPLNPTFVKTREIYVKQLRSILKMVKVNQTVLDSAEKFISEIERGVKPDSTIVQLQYYSDEFNDQPTQVNLLIETIGDGIREITKILNFDENVDFAAFVRAKEAADIGKIISFLKSHENINIKKINEGLDNFFSFNEIETIFKFVEFDENVDFVAFGKANNKCYNIGKIIKILESNKNINIKKINEGLDIGYKNFDIDEIATLLEFDQNVDFATFAKAKNKCYNFDEIMKILNSNQNIKIQKINEELDNGFGIYEINAILKIDPDADFVEFAKAIKQPYVDIGKIMSFLNRNENVNIQKINKGLDNGFTFNEITKILKFDKDVDFVAFAEANKKCAFGIGVIIEILNSNENVNIKKIDEGLDNKFKIYEIKKILNIKADVDFTPLAGRDIDEIIQMLIQKKI